MFHAYENALSLARSLRPLVETLRRHDPELADQLSRACTSVVLNIGEGARRHGKDKRRFYFMAQGSASEIRGCLDLAEVIGIVLDDANARAVLDRELALLWGLTHDRKPS